MTTFSWSYSRLKNFESCPLKYKTVDIDKLHVEKSQELDRGGQLHEAMYQRVANGTKLPVPYSYMERWAKRLTMDLHPMQETYCELKLALNDDYQPTAFMGHDVWCRARIDYLKIIPRQAHVVDYKTGKPRLDDTQLALSAAMVMCHYPEVDQVRTEYLWTEYGDTSHKIYQRNELSQIWDELLPRVFQLEEAHKHDQFPAVPNGLCAKYCPVNTCPHWGKSFRREARSGATVS
jgi:uncharacterized protein Usg